MLFCSAPHRRFYRRCSFPSNCFSLGEWCPELNCLSSSYAPFWSSWRTTATPLISIWMHFEGPSQLQRPLWKPFLFPHSPGSSLPRLHLSHLHLPRKAQVSPATIVRARHYWLVRLANFLHKRTDSVLDSGGPFSLSHLFNSALRVWKQPSTIHIWMGVAELQ